MSFTPTNNKKPAYEIAIWDKTSANGYQYQTGTFTINELEINGVLFKDIKFPFVNFKNHNAEGTKRPSWTGKPPSERKDDGPKTPPLVIQEHAAAIRKTIEAPKVTSPTKPVDSDFWDDVDSIPF